MTALDPVDHVVLVSLIHTYGSDHNVTTRWHHGYSGGPPLQADVNAIASGVYSAWQADLASLHSTVVTLTSVKVTDLSSETAFQGVAGAGAPGTRAGGELTAATAVVCNFTSNRRYRGGKPKMFFPMGVESDINTPQAWSTGFQTQCATGLSAFFNAVAAIKSGTTQMGGLQYVSYYSGSKGTVSSDGKRGITTPTPRHPPVVYPIGAISVSLIPGSQRRRMRPG